MNFKKYIPNLLTLGNLLSGTIAAIFAVNESYEIVALLVVLGIFFDFLDGFVARLLNVSGELGKQLDSLADMVTSGVVPGIVMFNLLGSSNNLDDEMQAINSTYWDDYIFFPIQFFGLLLTLGACYRLAKFNIDTRQTSSFIGLPSPAMSLFVISLPLIMASYNYSFVANIIESKYFLLPITLVLTFVMNAEMPLFSLKFKDYSMVNNKIKYFFLASSLSMIVVLKQLSIPLIIVLYIILSLTHNFKNNAISKRNHTD